MATTPAGRSNTIHGLNLTGWQRRVLILARATDHR
jgi:hypothetical protein